MAPAADPSPRARRDPQALLAARRLTVGGARVVALLPVGRSRARRAIVRRLALAVTRFSGQTVAVVTADEEGGTLGLPTHEVALAGSLTLVTFAAAAAHPLDEVELDLLAQGLAGRFSRVLVDLGCLPAALRQDGARRFNAVALLVSEGRTRSSEVSMLARLLEHRLLGAVVCS